MKYWPMKTLSLHNTFGIEMDAHTLMAWELIHAYGAIAGTPGQEDRSGRATMALQDSQDLVKRCFAIADAFIALAEERGGIKPSDEPADEERARQLGNLKRIEADAQFEREMNKA